MKKILAMTIVLATVVSMLAGCGSKEEARKTLTVGFDAEFPPYGYMNDKGEYEGFDLDLAQAVCDKQGWELVKQPIDWDAKDMELSSGTIDCIWNGFTINGREDAYTWSVPYIDNSQVFVVAKDSGIAKKADLAGKIVGVQKDSSALAALNDEETPENVELKNSFADLIEYGDYNTAFMDLEAGSINAVAMDIGVANYQLSSRGDAYVILDEELSTEQYGIGFLKGNTELKDIVEKSLLELYKEGVVTATAKKYDIAETMICLK
ncbi:MAG: amino acid ABC transporter substrate-binding protein [Lachnospiraceae bacterium]|nr:amino acid ABC transporter substrate-binding protein [Lachnospiraceae bacterium]